MPVKAIPAEDFRSPKYAPNSPICGAHRTLTHTAGAATPIYMYMFPSSIECAAPSQPVMLDDNLLQ